MVHPVRRRATAVVVAIALLVVGVVAAAPPTDGILLTPAADVSAVAKGQAVQVDGQITLATSSSFIQRASLIGYDADGNEAVRQQVTFNVNRDRPGEEHLDVDSEGNVSGLVGLRCEFGDASSMEQDQVNPACKADNPADGVDEDQTVTARDAQLEIIVDGTAYYSDLVPVDPISPIIERYELVSPTTILVTTSEPVTHPTGSENANDWQLPDNEARVVDVQRDTGDCRYAPGQDTRPGPDGCTFLLTVSPALGRDATPRVKYEPSETRFTNPDNAKHVDWAGNQLYLRSVEPTRGDRFESLAADRVGPLPPVIDTVAGDPGTDEGEDGRVVLDNEPQPTLAISEVPADFPIEVQVDGVAAGTGTSNGGSTDVALDAPLDDGRYALTATTEDTALCDPNEPDSATCANPSDPSEVVTYDLDTVAPVVTGDVLARSSSITIAFTEDVTGPDEAADWTVIDRDGNATSVQVTGVEDDGDGTSVRRLTITGGTVPLGAQLVYAPTGDAYQDEHTNPMAGFTVPLLIAELPIAGISAVDGDETEEGLLGETTPIEFTIKLDEPIAPGETAAVDFETAPFGSATLGDSCADGVDAVATSGTVTFDSDPATDAPDQTSDAIQVQVCSDELDEFDTESVVLQLSNPRGLRLAGGSDTAFGVGTITDDDLPPTIDFTDQSPELTEGETEMIEVSLDGPSGKDVEVAWTTVFDLSANDAGGTRDDLADQSGTVMIPAGQTSDTFPVSAIDDLEVEDEERFALELDASVVGANAVEPDDEDGARVVVDLLDNDIAVPVVTVAGGEVDEDARGDLFLIEPGTLEFEVRLSRAVNRTIRVDFETTDGGTATPDEEFTPTSGTLEFEPGDEVGLVSVEIADDQLDEEDETIELVLSRPDGQDIAFPDGPTVAALGTIVDDDPLAEVAFVEDSAERVVEEGGKTRFTIELDTASAKPITVDWTTRFTGGNQAATDADVAPQSGTVEIAPGDTTGFFDIETRDDEQAEPDETLAVDLQVVEDEDNVALDEERPTTATLTIADNEVVLPTLGIEEGATVGEDDPAVPPFVRPQLTFTVTLSEVSDNPVEVDFTTVAVPGDDGAAPEDDYIASSGTLTIPADSDSATIDIAVLDDELDEFPELVGLSLSEPRGARLPGGSSTLGGFGTIIDGDPLAEVSLASDEIDVEEGVTAEVDVVLDTVSGKDIDVTLTTTGSGDADEATADDDYDTTSVTRTIPAGDDSVTIRIPTTDDAVDEPNETFDVELTIDEDDDTADLGDPAVGTVTILDNDVDLSGPPVVALSAAEVEEGNPPLPTGTTLLPSTTMQFDVSLSRAATGDVTIDYRTVPVDGSAAPGSDYQGVEDTVTIEEGDTTATIDVGVFPDGVDEVDEVFTLEITGVTDNAQTPGLLARLGTILDDDPLATLGFAEDSVDVEVDEGGEATFTVELVGATEKAVSFDYVTSFDGSADRDDLPEQSGTVIVRDGVGTFTIETTDDELFEDPEDVSVLLRNPSGAALAEQRPTTATLTIDDDEVVLPTLTVTGGSVDEDAGVDPLVPAALPFTLELSEPAPTDVTVDVSTIATSGTATAEADYRGTSETVTIPQGDDSATFTVDVLDDDVDEFIEEVVLEAADVDGARLPGDVDSTRTIGRILDDDPEVMVNIGEDRTVTEGNPATFQVTLTAASEKPITVSYSTADGSATAAEGDYVATSGEIDFAPGETSDSFTVVTEDDFVDEPTEDLLVDLAVVTEDAVDLGERTSATLNIDDDDLPDPGDLPVLGLGAGTITEGTLQPTLAPTTELDFEVRISETVPDDEAVVVGFTTTSAGATESDDVAFTEGEDYFVDGDEVTIEGGNDSATVTVRVFPDAVDEFDEGVQLTLTEVREGDAALPGGSVARTGVIVDDDPLATLGFDDDSLDVGVTEGGAVELTVDLVGETAKDVSVDYALSFDGGATRDEDAASQTGTLTFPAGTTSQTFEVTTLPDDVDEPAEAFSVVLSGPAGAQLDGAADVATVTINDDDLLTPVLSVAGGVVDEGLTGPLGPFAPVQIAFVDPAAPTPVEEGLVFTVSLSEATERDITVDFMTVDSGDAVAGSDYTATSGSTTIPAGETSVDIVVDVLDDGLDEFAEQVVLRVTRPDGATLSNGASRLDTIGTIEDDDPLVDVTIGDDVEVAEGEPATFDVTLSAVSGKDVVLRASLGSGSATAGDDVREPEGTFTIPAGDTSTTFSLQTVDDAVVESTEDIEVRLALVPDARGETAELVDGTATLTITDDDVDVDGTVASLTGAVVDEGNPATPLPLPVPGNTLDFEVRLSQPADGDVTLDVATRTGSAGEQDFAPRNGQVTIPDGEDSVTVPVEVTADRLDEFDEDLQLVVTRASGDVVVPGGELTRTGRIRDDDPQALLRVSDATVLEGSVASLDVTLDTPSGKDIEVDWRLVSGTATSGEDFQPASGTLSFPAGTTSRTVDVATLADDDSTELIEQFELVLSSPVNAGSDDPRGTVSIVDVEIGPDGLPIPTQTAVFLEDITTTEADRDRTALVPVRLSAESDEDVTVTWSSQRLTAADGEDYRAEGGEFVIPAGDERGLIPVTIIGDDEVEGNEDFLLLLTRAEGAVITGPTGRVTIEDDDAADDGGGGGDAPGPDDDDETPGGDGDDVTGAPGSDGGGGGGGGDGGGSLPATGGGTGLVVLGLGLLAARRRRRDES